MVGLAIAETLEVVAPPFPKWYVEAPVDDYPRGKLMDEVRTALLDYPSPEGIAYLFDHCVGIEVTAHLHLAKIAEHLMLKGFRFYAGNFGVYEDNPGLRHLAVFGRS